MIVPGSFPRLYGNSVLFMPLEKVEKVAEM